MEREAIVEARREAERLMATAKVELKAAYEARQEAADAREAVQRVQQAVEAQVDAAKMAESSQRGGGQVSCGGGGTGERRTDHSPSYDGDRGHRGSTR